jgi:hypothetical protein
LATLLQLNFYEHTARGGWHSRYEFDFYLAVVPRFILRSLKDEGESGTKASPLATPKSRLVGTKAGLATLLQLNYFKEFVRAKNQQ